MISAFVGQSLIADESDEQSPRTERNNNSISLLVGYTLDVHVEVLPGVAEPGSGSIR